MVTQKSNTKAEIAYENVLRGQVKWSTYLVEIEQRVLYFQFSPSGLGLRGLSTVETKEKFLGGSGS